MYFSEKSFPRTCVSRSTIFLIACSSYIALLFSLSLALEWSVNDYNTQPIEKIQLTKLFLCLNTDTLSQSRLFICTTHNGHIIWLEQRRLETSATHNRNRLLHSYSVLVYRIVCIAHRQTHFIDHTSIGIDTRYGKVGTQNRMPNGIFDSFDFIVFLLSIGGQLCGWLAGCVSMWPIVCLVFILIIKQLNNHIAHYAFVTLLLPLLHHFRFYVHGWVFPSPCVYMRCIA